MSVGKPWGFWLFFFVANFNPGENCMHLQNETTYRVIEIPEIHIEFQFSDYVIALKTKEVLFYTQVRV